VRENEMENTVITVAAGLISALMIIILMSVCSAM
jgi:hypothetical protein